VQTHVTERVSTSDTNWLQGIHYTLDLSHRQITIQHQGLQAIVRRNRQEASMVKCR
jgi:hypothetical protein